MVINNNINRFSTFSLSVTGASHKIVGKCIQDYSLNCSSDDYSLICTADGHGGADYFRSNVGSKKACDVFAKCYKEFSKDNSIFNNKSQKEISEILTHFFKHFITSWREEIQKEANDFPFTEEEMTDVSDNSKKEYLNQKNIFKAYGTTFLSAVLTSDYCFGYQLGDGEIRGILKNGEIINLVEDDPLCQGNVTTSLCQDDAIKYVRFFFFKKIDDNFPFSIILSTDGLINSFETEEHFNMFIKQLYNEATITKQENLLDLENELEDKLSLISKKGSGDDISVAGIIIKEGEFLNDNDTHTLIESDDKTNTDYIYKNDTEIVRNTQKKKSVKVKNSILKNICYLKPSNKSLYLTFSVLVVILFFSIVFMLNSLKINFRSKKPYTVTKTETLSVSIDHISNILQYSVCEIPFSKYKIITIPGTGLFERSYDKFVIIDRGIVRLGIDLTNKNIKDLIQINEEENIINILLPNVKVLTYEFDYEQSEEKVIYDGYIDSSKSYDINKIHNDFRKEIISESLEEREKEMYEDLGEYEGNFLKEALKEIDLYRKKNKSCQKKRF